MAIIKKNEMASTSADELRKKMRELQTETVKENAQRALGTTPKNPGRIREMRRTIARIKQKLAKEGIKANE